MRTIEDGIKMKVTIRPFQSTDINLVEQWAIDIDAGIYMSKHIPTAFTSGNLSELAQDNRVLWFIINVSENERPSPIGTVYLEQDSELPTTMKLGVMIGKTEYFGKGIGREAISQAISRMRELRPDVTTVRLRVRKYNYRAQRCYLSVGFERTTEGSYINQIGELIDYQIMELKMPSQTR